MNFLCGILGAIIFAALAWIAIGAVGIAGWVTYIIAGAVAYAGFSLAQWLYEKARR